MEDKNKIFTWKIGGQAGQGQQAAGLIFAKSCTLAGQYTFTYSEFPSLIRGGHVSSSVSVSSRPITAIYKKIQLLVALNEETLKHHTKLLTKDGIIIYDGDSIKNYKPSAKAFSLPLETLVKKNNLRPLTKNIIAIILPRYSISIYIIPVNITMSLNTTSLNPAAANKFIIIPNCIPTANSKQIILNPTSTCKAPNPTIKVPSGTIGTIRAAIFGAIQICDCKLGFIMARRPK